MMVTLPFGRYSEKSVCKKLIRASSNVLAVIHTKGTRKHEQRFTSNINFNLLFNHLVNKCQLLLIVALWLKAICPLPIHSSLRERTRQIHTTTDHLSQTINHPLWPIRDLYRKLYITGHLESHKHYGTLSPFAMIWKLLHQYLKLKRSEKQRLFSEQNT